MVILLSLLYWRKFSVLFSEVDFSTTALSLLFQPLGQSILFQLSHQFQKLAFKRSDNSKNEF